MLTKIEFNTPAGTLVAVAHGSKLAAVVFSDHWTEAAHHLERRFGRLELDLSAGFPHPLGASLRAYLEGDVEAIDRLAVDVDGTSFQERVWGALRTIPAGETVSYQELARRAGDPGAARAAGNANGRNPVAVVIPCHRVIHADGSIGGYSGGLEKKRWLLSHEQKHARRARPYACA
jgi:methylated-DNA-[protein]-cysteine S-methyltransferase